MGKEYTIVFLKRIAKLVIPEFIIVIIQRIKWGKGRNATNTSFKYSDDPNVFHTIYKTNYWGSTESRSGGGSQITTTKVIREMLPILWKKYNIKTFLDIPCGDFNWMKEVEKKSISYVGGDIVPELIDQNNKYFGDKNVLFKVLDVTKDPLPKVDMIFCKDCLQHLSYKNVFIALENFKKSNSKYLLTTSYPLTLINWDICDGDCRPLNLRATPFKLPSPVLKIHEKSTGYSMEADKCLYLFEIKKIISNI